MKSVRRRSVAGREGAAGVEGQEGAAPRLSENISLFQSLRVLQEDEEDAEMAPSTGIKWKKCLPVLIIDLFLYFIKHSYF